MYFMLLCSEEAFWFAEKRCAGQFYINYIHVWLFSNYFEACLRFSCSSHSETRHTDISWYTLKELFYRAICERSIIVTMIQSHQVILPQDILLFATKRGSRTFIADHTLPLNFCTSHSSDENSNCSRDQNGLSGSFIFLFIFKLLAVFKSASGF